MESYNYIKALHLIFVITWFAGLFYVPRLFIYQIEANKKASPKREILGEQLRVMARRLWYFITWPSSVLATLFAIWLLVLVPTWLQQGWMHVKLVFVLFLFLYHGKTHRMFLELQKGVYRYSSTFMRIWNEGATIILFAVVFIVILKDSINWLYATAGLLGLIILIMLGVRIYKKIRMQRGEE